MGAGLFTPAPASDILPLDVWPASPHAADDHFDAGSLDAKWTDPITSTRTSTKSFSGSWLIFEPSDAGSSSTGARGGWGIRQNSPTGDFKVKAKVTNGRSLASDDARVGIFIADVGTNKCHIFGWQDSVPRVANITGLTYSESGDWGAYDGSTDVSTTVLVSESRGLWYRMDWTASGGLIDCYYSTNGVAWTWLVQRTGHAQPDRMGLAIWGNTADIRADHKVGVDWFRCEE